MLGKLAGAFIGSKIAGRHEGAKGAILGYGAAAIARRGLPTLAAVAALGWFGKKMWDKRQERRHPAYPSEAAPASPSGD